MTPASARFVVGTAIVLTALVAAGCSSSAPLSRAGQPAAMSEERLLSESHRHIEHHRPDDAIATLDSLIARLEAQHTSADLDVYCSRSMSETMLYMLKAQSEGRNAVAIDPTWAEAYYLKGYALIELRRPREAREELEKAVKLSPSNSKYLSELAHTWHADRNWEKALEIFTQAEDAGGISPDAIRAQELGRAIRGQGFSLIELRRLDEAEARFRAALEIDGNDVKARQELEYIEHLRNAPDADPATGIPGHA